MSNSVFGIAQKQHIRLGDLPDTEIAEILSKEDLLEQSYAEVSLDEWGIPLITLADEELNLFHKVVNGLTRGKMTYGAAVFLTAMYACAVEDRIMRSH